MKHLILSALAAFALTFSTAQAQNHELNDVWRGPLHSVDEDGTVRKIDSGMQCGKMGGEGCCCKAMMGEGKGCCCKAMMSEGKGCCCKGKMGGKGGMMMKDGMSMHGDGPMGRMDADGDGKVTKTEMLNRASHHFDQVDTNRDGAIDEAEKTAMRQRMHDKRGMMPEQGSGDRLKRNHKGHPMMQHQGM
jgi:hypothetical protein